MEPGPVCRVRGSLIRDKRTLLRAPRWERGSPCKHPPAPTRPRSLAPMLAHAATGLTDPIQGLALGPQSPAPVPSRLEGILRVGPPSNLVIGYPGNQPPGASGDFSKVTSFTQQDTFVTVRT